MKPVAFIWSSVLHVVLLVAVIVGLPWRVERPPPAIVAAPVQGVIIDQEAIQREKARQEEAARLERQRQQREDRQRREAAEQQRLAEQREQQRVADERARAETRRKQEELLAAERAEQRRRDEQAKAEREAREAQAKREREEAEKRAAEQLRRQQAEAELQAQLAAEAEANAARAAGLLDQYMLMIENHVKRHWQAPLSARPGIECLVNVVQLPTGDVVSAKVGQCNGDEAVRRSIENAVLDASPLPRPPSQAVFSRSFTITFAPDK
jgi:colicin import membrane protein